MHILLLVSLLSIEAMPSQTIATDTLAFRQYLSHSTVADYVQVRTLAKLYQAMAGGLVRSPDKSTSEDIPHDSFYNNYTYSPQADCPSLFVIEDDFSFFEAQAANASVPNHLIRKLSDSIKSYRLSFEDVDAEKQRLVRALTAFDSVSTHKPIFYADIYGRFKGSAAKYVDYLFKKSFLFRKSHLEKFVRYPKAKTLQHDLGVQFVIGLALYESWIRDVREGRVTEETADKMETQP